MEPVRVRLVDEATGQEIAIVALTRLPVQGDRIVVDVDGKARLLVVQVVAHVPTRPGAFDGVAVVVERRAATHKGADVVPFLTLVRDPEPTEE
jgi:hypothetical protein